MRPPALRRLDDARAAPYRQAIAMEVSAMGIEPRLGALETGIELGHQPPEPWRVVELDQVRDLVRGEIVEHVGWREDETPGERKHAGRRAGAPAAGLVAHRDPLEGDAELPGMTAARGLKLAPGLPLEEVGDAAVEVRRLSGNAKQPVAAPADLGPHGSTRTAPVHDAVRHATQGHLDAMRERRRLGQSLEPRRNPTAVRAREIARFLQAATRRDSEHHIARRGVDAQRIAASLPVPAQLHEID